MAALGGAGARKQVNDIVHAFVAAGGVDGPLADVVVFPGDTQNFAELMQR